jgi:hypothetical protein
MVTARRAPVTPASVPQIIWFSVYDERSLVPMVSMPVLRTSVQCINLTGSSYLFQPLHIPGVPTAQVFANHV